MQLSKKRKIFSNFSFYFVNLHSILNFFYKKMNVIANLFLNLWNPREIVR